MKEKKIYTKSSENIKIIVNPHRRGSGNLEHSRHSKNKSLKFGEGLTACIDDYEIQEKIGNFLLKRWNRRNIISFISITYSNAKSGVSEIN